MTQAKPHSGKHGHSVCGNCARTIKVRNDSDNVVCLAHLHFVSASHEADCVDFKPSVADGNEPLIVTKTES
jgi:hypothetical protein